MNKAFSYTLGASGGDCTSPYYIRINGEPILKDCIEQILSNPREWGYIGVDDGSWMSTFGKPNLEYRNGDITRDDVTEEYLNKIVVSGRGSGGWSLSNFIFKLKED